MPAVGNIVINDGATTPVSHTFTPLGKDEKGVLWFEQTTPAPASPLGAKRIGYKQERVMDQRKQATGESRVIWTVSVPTLEVIGVASNGINPPPTLAYVEKVRVEFTLPERSLAQERKDARALTYNLLANTMAISAVDLLQPTF